MNVSANEGIFKIHYINCLCESLISLIAAILLTFMAQYNGDEQRSSQVTYLELCYAEKISENIQNIFFDYMVLFILFFVIKFSKRSLKSNDAVLNKNVPSIVAIMN